MSTLSLDLRGVETSHLLPREAPTKGASLSVSLHVALITTMVLVSVLQPTNPPEVAHASAAPLVRPITVMLPLSQMRPAPARRTSRSIRPAQALAIAPLTPADTPASFDVVSEIDAIPGPIGDTVSPGAGDVGIGDGTCPLGSLCGAAVVAVDPPPSIVHIGGVIREPRLIESRAPVYPPLAQSAGVSGKVVLEAHIGQDGRVREVRITESHGLFDAAALASVRSRRYEPLLLNGVPTDFLITITVAFTVRR